MSNVTTTENEGKKEIYTYRAPWPVYSMSWSRRGIGRNKFRMAIGSFKEEYSNEISIIQLVPKDRSLRDMSLKGRYDDSTTEPLEFEKRFTFNHPYPPTKISFAPGKYEAESHKDLLATTGDYLRIWSVDDKENRVDMKALLNNNRHTEYCAPVTSFDWNEIDPNIIGTCSIDTTCTIWDIEREQAKTQLIAHDKEVYDIAFASDTNLFATVGADGSLRIFDLRSLEHSTILYESPSAMPLLRIAWNKLDNHFIATIMTESSTTTILDIRMPSLPFAELGAHTGHVNSIAWAPYSANHIATGSEDNQALIWDINLRDKVEDPVLAYTAEAEINQLQWSGAHEDYIGIAYKDEVQYLKV